MNVVSLTGRITKTPELRTVKNAQGDDVSVLNFVLVTHGRAYKDADGKRHEDSVYVPIEVWDSGAENIAKYFEQGDGIEIEGALKLDTWKDKDGNLRNMLKVRCSHFKFPYSQKRREEVGAKD